MLLDPDFLVIRPPMDEKISGVDRRNVEYSRLDKKEMENIIIQLLSAP